jgi:hypothetical protein
MEESAMKFELQQISEYLNISRYSASWGVTRPSARLMGLLQNPHGVDGLM